MSGATDIQQEAERQLTHALITLSGRTHEYQSNADFHTQVNLLVRLLPSMINGMAVEAEKGYRERQERIRVLMHEPSFTIDLDKARLEMGI